MGLHHPCKDGISTRPHLELSDQFRRHRTWNARSRSTRIMMAALTALPIDFSGVIRSMTFAAKSVAMSRVLPVTTKRANLVGCVLSLLVPV